MRFTNRLGGVLAAVAVLVTASATMLPAQSAQAAVGCYGDYCSGKDPNATGCGADAKTVASTTVDFRTWWGAYVDVGTLEVRWSAKCKTNWARLSMFRGAEEYKGIELRQDSGYSVHYYSGGKVPGTSAGVYWTPMIYSPTRRVFAQIDRVWPWSCNRCATGWV